MENLVKVSYTFIQTNNPQYKKLKYIISYRGHDDFHEHCAEQIFCDLLNVGDFDSLTVSARYTRRGGLDINPTRSLNPVSELSIIGRLARQ